MATSKNKSRGTTLAQNLVNCNDTIMSLDDTADFLRKSREAVKRMCQKGRIPAHKDGKTWFLLKSEVVDWCRTL